MHFVQGTNLYFLKRKHIRLIPYLRPVQHDVQEWKARISIRSFDDIGTASTWFPPYIQPSATSPLLSPQTPPSSISLTPHLCYACHTTLTSRSSRGTASHSKSGIQSPVVLPVWVRSRLLDTMRVSGHGIGTADPGTGNHVEFGETWERKKMEPDEMKNAVADFLLNE